MALKRGLFFTLFLFTLQASRIRDLSMKGGNKDVKYGHFYEAPQTARHLSAVRDSSILNKLRVKKSALFSTGVKACPQETMAEVIASHKSYYKLRVCQKAVWEAFQIFLDRVPDTTEFNQWLHACQTDSLCVEELAHNFSSAQEHLDMLARIIHSIQDNQEHAMTTSVPHKKCVETPKEKFSVDSEKTKVSAVQHIIKFSVTVTDPDHSQLQRNHDNFQYQDAPHSLQEQMLRIFSKLVGFKEIRQLGIQTSSPGSVAVHYAVVFETEVDSTKIGPSGTAGESGTEIVLQDMVLKALREDTSLPLSIHSLNFESTTQNHLRYLPTDQPRHLPGVLNMQEAVAISKENTETINNSEDEAAPNGTQGRDEEAIGSTFPTQETSNHLPIATTLVIITESSPPESSGGPSPNEAEELNLIPDTIDHKRKTTLDSPSKVSEVEQALGNEIAAMPSSLDLNSIKALRASTSNQYSESFVDVSKAPFKEEILVIKTEVSKAEDRAGTTTGAMEPSSVTRSSEVPSTNDPTELMRYSLLPRTEGTIQNMQPTSIHQTVSSVDLPSLPSALPGNFIEKERQFIQKQSTPETKARDYQDFINSLPSYTNSPQSPLPSLDKGVGVFFSVHISNTIFSEDIIDRNSSGYKSLENTFLELLLQFLQPNLNGFNELHILSYRNGSLIVNNKMNLVRPVMDNITKAVHYTSDNFINVASKRMDSETDTQSADLGDPCKYIKCNEFSHCEVNTLTTEAECLCDAGYSTVDGLPCQSICIIQPNYCLNGGLCENIPGHGASCRCPAGKYWYYDGEHCSELVSLPVNPFILVLCLTGSLTLVCAVIGLLVFVNRKCIRTRKTVTLVHSYSHLSMEGIMRINPVFENDDGVLTHVSSISYPTITGSGSSQPSDHSSFYSLENMQLSIEIPRQLYTTRSEKLVSEIVGFHQCMPHVETWRLSNEHRTSCCLLEKSDSDGIEVTVL